MTNRTISAGPEHPLIISEQELERLVQAFMNKEPVFYLQVNFANWQCAIFRVEGNFHEFLLGMRAYGEFESYKVIVNSPVPLSREGLEAKVEAMIASMQLSRGIMQYEHFQEQGRQVS